MLIFCCFFLFLLKLWRKNTGAMGGGWCTLQNLIKMSRKMWRNFHAKKLYWQELNLNQKLLCRISHVCWQYFKLCMIFFLNPNLSTYIFSYPTYTMSMCQNVNSGMIFNTLLGELFEI